MTVKNFKRDPSFFYKMAEELLLCSNYVKEPVMYISKIWWYLVPYPLSTPSKPPKKGRDRDYKVSKDKFCNT